MVVCRRSRPRAAQRRGRELRALDRDRVDGDVARGPPRPPAPASSSSVAPVRQQDHHAAAVFSSASDWRRGRPRRSARSRLESTASVRERVVGVGRRGREPRELDAPCPEGDDRDPVGGGLRRDERARRRDRVASGVPAIDCERSMRARRSCARRGSTTAGPRPRCRSRTAAAPSPRAGRDDVHADGRVLGRVRAAQPHRSGRGRGGEQGGREGGGEDARLIARTLVAANGAQPTESRP